MDPVRLLIASVLFLTYETVLVVVFGDYFYEGVLSAAGYWGMIAAAALGYVFLGWVSRASVSVVVGTLPALLAWYLDQSTPVEANLDAMPLYQTWITSVFIFLPAWLVGLLGSRIFIARREGAMRQR